MATLAVIAALLLPAVLGKLPPNFQVTSYDLDLTVPSNPSSPVGGKVTIGLTTISENGAIIMLHWGSSLNNNPVPANFTITYSTPENPPKTVDAPISGFSVSLNPTLNQLTVNTKSTLIVKDCTVKITANFLTRINADNMGLFYRQYPVGNNQNNVVLLTNLRPTYARELFPCLDEPTYLAPLTLKLTYPQSWGVAATTAMSGSPSSATDGTTTASFLTTGNLPANAFAFFLAESMVQYNYSVARSRTTMSFWIRTNFDGTKANSIAQFLGDYFYLVEDTVGFNSPLPHITVVVVPGLEKPYAGYGVIFIREDNYLQDFTNPQLEGLFKSTVAPVVYQYLRQFTEFSQPADWSDYWVSQAIAQYLHYVILNTVMPIYDFKTDLEVIARQTALYLDSQPDTKPLQDTSVNVDSTASVQYLVDDPLKRLKGATILNMLDQSLAAGTVFAAVKRFLSSSVQPKNTDAFLAAIRGISTVNPDATSALTTTLPLWVSTNSYPLESVTVYRTGTPGTVNFTTTGFCSVLNPSCKTTLTGVYVVSVTVGSKTDNHFYTPRQDFWVRSSTPLPQSINIDVQNNDWVVANIKSGGYYRSTYEDTNWMRIIDALSQGDSRLVGRTQLIDDAFALSLKSSEPLNYNVTVSLALANLANPTYRDWVPVKRGLREIRNNLLGLDIYDAYQKFAASYFKDLSMLLNNKTYDASEKAKIEGMFYDELCEFNIYGYRGYAQMALNDLLKGTLPTEVVSSAYDSVACCGATYNSTLDPQTLWNVIVDPNRSYYARRYASVALGCLPNYQEIAKLFSTMYSTNIQLKHYVQIALENVADRNPANFLTNFTQVADKFQSQIGPVAVASLITRAGSKVNTNDQASVLDNINSNNNINTFVKTAATNAKNAIGYKVSWLFSNNATLVTALRTFTPAAPSGANTVAVVSLLVLLPSFLLVL